jgi:hypothetical protein
MLAVGNDAVLLRKCELEAALTLEKRDPEPVPETSLSVIPKPRRNASAAARKTAPKPISCESHSFSPAALARSLLRRDDCKATVVADPGPPPAIRPSSPTRRRAPRPQCSFLVNHGISLSTTLTSSSDQTITNNVGASLSTTAGSDLLGFSETVGVSYDFAIAIGTGTGKNVENGTTVTITNNLGQALGTTAFVTFTPT